MTYEHFCGCCGNEIAEVYGTDPIWCWPCAGHVMREGRVPLHESTFFAQHGVDCPFQVGSDASQNDDPECSGRGFCPSCARGRSAPTDTTST